MSNRKLSTRAATYDETDDFLQDMQHFRRKAIAYAVKWEMASPERQASEGLLVSIDRFAQALTGVERFFSSASAETEVRQRRGWSA